MLEDGAPEENYQDEGELAARDASLLSQDEIHHEVRVRRVLWRPGMVFSCP
jgi:hypothetical protein